MNELRQRICSGNCRWDGRNTGALVSLDADLHELMLAGLEFFYPKLSPGAAIVVHDYNGSRFSGMKKKVRE